MVKYLLQKSILYIYVLYYHDDGVLQCAPMSTLLVLLLVPMLLQLTRTVGKL